MSNQLMKPEALYPDIITRLLAQETQASISEELGVDRSTLRRWMKKEEFQRMWADALEDSNATMGTARESAMTYIRNLLPEAMVKMKELLDSAIVPAATKWRIIERVMEISEVGTTRLDGAAELREFLKSGVINIVKVDQQVVIQDALGPEYAQALAAIMPSEIVDAEFVELGQDALE